MKILKSFSVYTIANFLELGIGFILLPIFTHYLSPQDYGTLALYTIYASIVSKIVTFGSGTVTSIEFFRLPRANFSSYFSSALLMPLIAFLLFLVASIIFSPHLSKLFSIPEIWITTIPLVAVFNTIFLLTKSYFRINNWEYKFIAINLANIILNLGLSLLFVIGYKMDWEGRSLGILLTGAVFFVLSFIILNNYKLLTLSIKKKYVRSAFYVGAPVILHSLGGFIINYSDKIFIEKLVGVSELGIYNVGYKIGSVAFIFTNAFMLAFSPFVYNSLKKVTTAMKLQIVKVSYIFITILTIIILLLWFLTPYFFEYGIDIEFKEAAIYVPWVSGSYFFHGLYSLFVVYIFFLKKTYILSILTFLSVILNIALNYFLILTFGAIGAAYATVISYFVFFVLVAYISNRLFPMPWFKKALLKF